MGGFEKYIPKKENGHNKGECLKRWGLKPSEHYHIKQLKRGILEPYIGGGPGLKVGTSHASSYYAFNLPSYNWIFSSKSCTCLMLFPRVNLKMHLGETHQRVITVTFKMPIIKKNLHQDLLFSFLYGIWFICMVYIAFYNK